MKNTTKISFALLFWVLCFVAQAQQNLVPNPSFEEYTQCPQGPMSFDVENWFSIGSVDYLNSCNNNMNCQAGVPCNLFGFQYAQNGDGYIGLITYVREVSNAREWAGVELIHALTQGVRYYVNMYVSLTYADLSGEIACCSVNKVGFKFTNTNTLNNTDNVSQVYSNVLISDTINWTSVSGSFIADSAYRYLFIGNFFDDIHTDVSCCNTQEQADAYFFIDMVSVSSDSSILSIADNTPNDEISIYPNPVSDVIFLRNVTRPINYSIIDIMGNEIQYGKNFQGNVINTNDISNGIYFLIINQNMIQKVSIIH